MSGYQIPFLAVDQTYFELKHQIDGAISRVLQKGDYILGSELNRFEKKFATYCESLYSLGVANGLDALFLALRACGVTEGDEVIVPSNTFIATWLAVSRCGAIPVAVSPDYETYNIDPSKIRNVISKKTKAIIPVHLFGMPADLDAIQEIAIEHNLYVIEDAAQAHGARYKNKRIGGFSDVTAWSFYPGKNLGAFGDGGAITTNNFEIAERVRTMRNYGSREKYFHESFGINSRLDEIQAAILSEKIEFLDEWNARRKKIAEKYQSGIKNPEIICPKDGNGYDSAWHLYVIRTQNRDSLQKKLGDKGVQTLVHYPIFAANQGAYAHLAFRGKLSKEDSSLCSQILSLPIGPHMSETQVDYIIDHINNW